MGTVGILPAYADSTAKMAVLQSISSVILIPRPREVGVSLTDSGQAFRLRSESKVVYGKTTKRSFESKTSP